MLVSSQELSMPNINRFSTGALEVDADFLDVTIASGIVSVAKFAGAP